MDCRVAKLLVYGAVFGCEAPCLTVAAGMSLAKGVFASPFHRRKEAALAKRALAKGTDSDLLAIVGAHEAAQGALDRRAFCRDHYLDDRALSELAGLRRMFRRHLVDAGLVQDSDSGDEATLDGTSSLLRGLLCAGLYPHVARQPPPADGGKAHAHLTCRDKSKWWCHPQSLNFETLTPHGKLKSTKTTLVVYNGRLKTSKPYLLDTSVVHPLALLLFGGTLRPSYDGTRIVLDAWLPFKATLHAQLAVLALRKEVDALLARSFESKGADDLLAAQRTLVVAAVRSLLALLTS